MECRDYGHLPDGRLVDEYTLDNGLGLKLTAITLGGIATKPRYIDGSLELARAVGPDDFS